MAKLIICQSKKPTWTKTWINEDPEHRVRFNKEDVSKMLDGVSKKEDIIYHNFMDEAMLAGYDIILDDVDLNDIKEIQKYVDDFNEWIRLSPLDIHYEIEFLPSDKA